jgi:hypothetical protein
MLRIIADRPHVLALEVSGHLSREDVSRCYDLFEPGLGVDGKQHLYVEVSRLAGIDSEILMHDLGRGLRLLGRLEQFGRVAIVSDQAWVRRLSRLESALLPGIAYRVYDSAGREQALAWVEGRAALPYGEALRLIETNRTDVVGVEVDGRLAAEEVGKVARELNRRRAQTPIKAMLLNVKGLEGVDPAIALDPQYLRMKLGLLRELDRYAVVGGPDWLTGWVDLVWPCLRLELRRFEPGAEAEAWTWLGATPVQAPLAA